MPEDSLTRRRLEARTEQLPKSSRPIYQVDHYSSQPAATWIAGALLLALLLVGAAVGFPAWWVTLYATATATVTVLMVFIIQHTAGREQAAVQRKLDELLRALPEATESLMLLEEAPEDALRTVEERQRSLRRSTTTAEPHSVEG